MPYNLDEIAIRTGIKTEKLKKEIDVMNALQDIFMELANRNQRVALFGGTALNKIYFGSKQRLSYDIDIESLSYGRTKKVITNVASKTIMMQKAYRAVYKDVVIDLRRSIGIEKPVLLKARSILEFFDYPVNSVIVPSYSLEYLLAQKTIAMLCRIANKDIYDTWLGLQLLTDKAKYRKYVGLLARKEGLDIQYLLAFLERNIRTGWDTEREKIDLVQDVNIRMAVGDVALRLRRMRIGG